MLVIKNKGYYLFFILFSWVLITINIFHLRRGLCHTAVHCFLATTHAQKQSGLEIQHEISQGTHDHWGYHKRINLL